MEEYVFIIAVGSYNNQTKAMSSTNRRYKTNKYSIKNVWELLDVADMQDLAKLITHSGDNRLRQIYDELKEDDTMESFFIDGISKVYPNNYKDMLGL